MRMRRTRRRSGAPALRRPGHPRPRASAAAAPAIPRAPPDERRVRNLRPARRRGESGGGSGAAKQCGCGAPAGAPALRRPGHPRPRASAAAAPAIPRAPPDARRVRTLSPARRRGESGGGSGAAKQCGCGAPAGAPALRHSGAPGIPGRAPAPPRRLRRCAAFAHPFCFWHVKETRPWGPRANQTQTKKGD